jgi:hypothetical protein
MLDVVFLAMFFFGIYLIGFWCGATFERRRSLKTGSGISSHRKNASQILVSMVGGKGDRGRIKVESMQ